MKKIYNPIAFLNYVLLQCIFFSRKRKTAGGGQGFFVIAWMKKYDWADYLRSHIYILQKPKRMSEVKADLEPTILKIVRLNFRISR